ncbi:hypothetical protein DRP53_01965 [candidate division WOR-3 bacterium]|uniref:Secretion system C-terminal sorting domain-containing protein n=1 Tax=candidate division WOR-3 bacterium TaxID=2052148 RepID=A0A660SKU6_UNCW3|nr:MAG: hypothetical protein DRP53_01965 [candidate division WOR-3 bacterium]
MPEVEQERGWDLGWLSFTNPTDGNLKVRYAYQRPTNLGIVGYDVQGRNCFSFHRRLSGQGTIGLDLTRLPEGVYLLRITEGDHQRIEKLVLLK